MRTKEEVEARLLDVIKKIEELEALWEDPEDGISEEIEIWETMAEELKWVLNA